MIIALLVTCHIVPFFVVGFEMAQADATTSLVYTTQYILFMLRSCVFAVVVFVMATIGLACVLEPARVRYFRDALYTRITPRLYKSTGIWLGQTRLYKDYSGHGSALRWLFVLCYAGLLGVLYSSFLILPQFVLSLVQEGSAGGGLVSHLYLLYIKAVVAFFFVEALATLYVTIRLLPPYLTWFGTFYRFSIRPVVRRIRIEGGIVVLAIVLAALSLLLGVLTLFAVDALLFVTWGCRLATELYFPLLAVLLCFAVVIFRNPMHSLLSLIGVFLLAVLIYITQGAEFLGLVFLIVYVGAVAILFLFVIMLLNVKSLTSSAVASQRLFQKFTLALSVFFAVLLVAFNSLAFMQQVAMDLPLLSLTLATVTAVIFHIVFGSNDITAIGLLYVEQVSLFFLITFILLVAMLGAIVLATATLDEEEPSVPSSRVASNVPFYPCELRSPIGPML
jgi:NADH-quinone oxidoreductase subunit J